MNGLRPWLAGLRLTLVLWLLSVVVASLPLLTLAPLLAPAQAEGSLLRRDGVVVGSRLIGQPVRSARYLQGRPGLHPHRAPADPELAARVAAAAALWQQQGMVAPAPDLLLDSGSGVDPHLSLAAARQQLPRLARERGLPPDVLERLLRQAQVGPWRLQAIEPMVNVLVFNLALDQFERADPPRAF